MAWICGALGVKTPKVAALSCKLCCHGPSVIGIFIYCLRILHIYAAKGLRAHTLAAAERMKALRRLDAKEHRGKVKKGERGNFLLQTAGFGMGTSLV